MISFDFEKIAPLCEKFGVTLSEQIRSRLSLYGNMLVKWNEKINLTAITAPEEILYKHFYDCILFFSAAEIPRNARIIDVGTGAGFPGMVLKILRPDIELTLLDGLNKRLIFLNEVLNALELQAETVHLRAEEGGRKPEYREKFDIACARAVAAMPVLCEYCLPFVKPGGKFVAMKGSSGAEESAAAENAAGLLGGGKPDIICRELRENEPRTFIIIKKISQTPTKYPRNGGKITKSAL